MAAPNVSIKEIDLSTRVPSFPGAYGGMVVRSPRGSVAGPVLVTSENDFLKYFTWNDKLPVDAQNEMRSALAFLSGSNKLWVVRAYSQPIVYDSWEAGLEVEVGTQINQTTGSTPEGYVWELTGTAGDEPDPLVTGDTEPTWPEDPDVDDTIDEVVNSGEANEYTLTWTYTAVTAAPLYGGVVIKKDDSTEFNEAFETGIRVDRHPDEVAYSFDNTNDALIIFAADPGDWNQKFAVRIITDSSVVKESGAFMIEVYKWTGSEAWAIVESHVVSMATDHIDGYGRNIYVEDYLKQNSLYIRAKVNDNMADPMATVVATGVWEANTTYAEGDVVQATDTSDYPNIVFRCTTGHDSGATEPTWVFTEGATTGNWKAFYSYEDLEGGDDGTLAASGDMVIALDYLRNSESYPLTILMDGGYSVPAFQLEMATLCANRHDCVFIHSLPFAQEKIAKVSGVQTLVSYKNTYLTALATSSFGSIYAGWVYVLDKYNNREVWVDPTGFVGAVISKTAANYELWYPPAGWKRGALTVLDVYDHYDTGEMDYLYDNNINPIRWNSIRGIAVFGQKTTLTRPSALDRLNVRLMLCVIEPAIKFALEDFLFEFNTVATRANVTAMINTYMSNIKSRYGVSDFKVKCDEENNTAYDIESHIMNVWLFVKPMNSVEYIPFSVIITRESMSFGLAAQQILNV